MSGRASWSAAWIANAAVFTLPSPSTTSPCELTRTRSLTLMWLNAIPKGFTQKWSRRSGSRAVMCPATPSSNPNLPKMRKPAARRCLRCWRSSSIVSYFGRYQRSSRVVVWAMAITSCVPDVFPEGRSRTEAAQAVELQHLTVVGDEETGGTRRLDQRTTVVDPGDERGFRQHLRSPRLPGHDRDRRQSRFRWLAGARVDEVVQRAVATRPRPAQLGARRDRALREREEPGAPGLERVVDVDHPAVRLRCRAPGAQITAHVHEHAGHAGDTG